MCTPIISGFAALPDTRIHYEVYGQGPALLLLHGNGETLHIFDGILEQLCTRYRVVAVDTRGHGQSGRGRLPLNFTTLAGDMAAMLTALDIPAAHVIGFSDGGNIALHMALMTPERVRSLTLMGANLNPGGIQPAVQAFIVANYYIFGPVSKLSKELAAKREVWGLMVDEPRLTPADIAGITAPTLVIAGEKDIVKPEHTAEICAAIPGARCSILPGLGHNVLKGRSQLLAPILAFLGEQS